MLPKKDEDPRLDVLSLFQQNQEQLIHFHRLATVGQLAAGAAHEINNPLTIISLNIQLLERMISRDMDAAGFTARLAILAGQRKRISKITHEILELAQPGESDFQPAAVRQIADRVLTVIRDRSSFQNIFLYNRIPNDLPLSFVDTMQIEQVLMNLLINAGHALPGGGKITLSAKASQKMVLLRVTDNGEGITPENKKRIFEPFFTTKTKGKGSGLGMAICNSIIEHNGGEIDARSVPGVGTSFIISLPLDKGGQLQKVKERIEGISDDLAFSLPKKSRILVIDDEKLLNDMIQEDLREAGYEVDGAYDGLEGIAKLGFKRYHLILLDIRMPRKNGMEVLDFIREHCPEIQVVIMTALATQPDVEQKIRNGAVACLKKPFRLEDLQETIRKALSSTEIEENQN